MKKFFLLISLVSTFAVFAQSKTVTDTVMQGYYIPLDSNVISCKVTITYNNITSDTVLKGNVLPSSLSYNIGLRPKGTVVVYHEITTLQKDYMVKANPVRYVIGSKNTKQALRNPSLPIMISAADLATIELDTSYISFTISFAKGKDFYEFKINGNKLSEQAKTAISELEPGTKVFLEQINATNNEGMAIKLPIVIYKIQ